MLELFPGKREWSMPTLRLLAQAQYGGADICECVATAERIRPGDGESWLAEWRALAERVEGQAVEALAQGHAVTARDASFRASNYYRMADFFLPGADPRKKTLFLAANRCFLEAAKHYRPPIEPIEIRYGAESYAGYFCHPKSPKTSPVPGIVLLGGADSLAEELLFVGGNQITERGMALLLIDTPGRGSSLRLKGIQARPDYEKPVGPVIDHLQRRPEVDPERIGLLGVSMGGYYAPRVAAFDRRVKAVVLNSGCLGIVEDLFDYYPPIRKQLGWIVGAKDDEEARAAYRAFTLGDVARQIACPILISHGADDIIMRPEGARRLYDAVGSHVKVLKMWTRDEGGAVHCSYDNWSRVFPFMFDWLADRLC